MAETTEQMYHYIVKDAADDVQDVRDGVNELLKITGDDQLRYFLSELNEMSTYLKRMENMPMPVQNFRERRGIQPYESGIDDEFSKRRSPRPFNPEW